MMKQQTVRIEQDPDQALVLFAMLAADVERWHREPAVATTAELVVKGSVVGALERQLSDVLLGDYRSHLARARESVTQSYGE